MDSRKYQLYKTEMCRNWQEMGDCRYAKKCRFAHGHQELRCVQRHAKYKTEICKTFHLTGTCSYGVRCTFIHDEHTPLTSSSSSSLSSSPLFTPINQQYLPFLLFQDDLIWKKPDTNIWSAPFFDRRSSTSSVSSLFL
ncbi:Zinc finger protein zfs1 [Choanephora cucurbitarum]|uniref:Zinc finger protein zfs1 n=1 Tax=Choanephora cucurbitarum TaxID=101091 RepID=A0A1C7NM69_9FUNG|nr:Zinc finger protein zfs1 [Choanephora cucurbitarum]